MTESKTGAEQKSSGQKQSFEKSLARLEKIVEEMEGGNLSLDDMVARFEEGRKLIGFCNRSLNEVERKIEKLVAEGDEIDTEPFEPETSEESDGGDLF